MPRSSMSSNAKFTSGEGYKLKMYKLNNINGVKMVEVVFVDVVVYRVHRLKLLGEILRLLLALEDWCYNLLAFFWEAEANANQ